MLRNSWICSTSKILSYLLIFIGFNSLTCLNLKHNIAVAQVISLTEPLVDQVQRPNRDQRLEQYRQQLRQRQEQFKEEYRQDWDQQQQQWRNQQKSQQQDIRDYRRQNQEKIYQQNQLRREQERDRRREQLFIVPRQLER